MKFKDFFQKNNGQSVEAEDESNLNQCFDLAFAWCDFISVPRKTIRHLRAYQVWTEPLDITLQYFDYIPNTPNGVPKEGDLVVFSKDVGVSGHISIASGKGDIKTFESFDQNWASVQYARLVTHPYTSVLGWLHNKSTTITDQTILDQAEAFVSVATLLNEPANREIVLAEIDKLIKIEDQAPEKDKLLTTARTTINNLEKDLEELKKKNESIAETNNNLTATVEKQTKTIEKYTDDLKVAQNSLQELKDQLQKPPLTSWRKIIYEWLIRR